MVFASMLNLFFITIIAVLAVLFLLGLTLLIIGIVRKRKPDNKGKKSPIVMMIIGSVLAAPALLCIILAVILKTTIKVDEKSWDKKYDSLPELYESRRLTESKAVRTALDYMLEDADAGDRDAFAKNFSSPIRNDEEFDKNIEAFFSAYPGSLSDLEFVKGGGSGSESLHYGHNEKTFSQFYSCRAGDEAYFISISVCYENTDNPSELGVTQFILWNTEGYADYKYTDYGGVVYPDDDEYCLCYMKTSDEVNARLVDGTPYRWTESDKEPITEAEMKDLLSNCYNIDDVRSSGLVGAPNVEYEIPNSTGEQYIYELKPENGEPRFVKISCSSDGRIIEAISDGDDKSDPSEWLVEFREKSD